MTRDTPPANDPDLRRAAELVSALCDDRIGPDEMRELETLVLKRQDVCRLYVRLMHLHAGLYQYASALGVLTDFKIDAETAEEPSRVSMSETMVLPALNDVVGLDAADEIGILPEPRAPRPAPPRRGSPLWRGAIAASIVVGISLAAYFLRPEPRLAVRPTVVPATQPATRPMIDAPAVPRDILATVESVYQPVWDATSQAPKDGAYVASESLRLLHGVVQLSLQSGGRLILEGPADLQFVSARVIELRHGKLVATVPGGGLVVRCPNGAVTDLGTEFGVSVDAKGTTDVAVFQGRVAATRGASAAGDPANGLVLEVGQAAVMSEASLKISPDGAMPLQFIRTLHGDATKLDVTDLISGGDGTTRRRGVAIDSVTGVSGVMPPTAQRAGDGAYHKIAGRPFVDGVFVPGSAVGPTQVTSAGHTFDFAPTTKQTFNYIWTGGKIPWPDEQGISTTIDGIDYAGDGHAIICTHANNALTLDLDAVRRIYPGRDLARFRCRAANSYINGWYGAQKIDPVATAQVLVDGKSRFQKAAFINRDGGFDVNLPLTGSDRYITLVATDAGVDIDHTWVLWADATLDLTPATPSDKP